MKKLFVAALAILGLVACVKDDVVSVQDNRTAIGFDTFVENVTRVGYNTGNLDGFDVWAYMGDTRILEGENVTKSNGVYTYGNTQYWIPGQHYFFAALAPLDLVNVTDDTNEGLGEITFTNVDGTTDLIYSTYSVTADGSQDKVNFEFNHLLSKVKFSFVNAFDNANYTFTVSNIKMTAPESASIDLTADEYTWGGHTGNITLEFGATQNEPASAGNKFSSDDLLTIPAGVGQVYNVTFDVNLYVAGTLARTYNKEAKISGIAFEAGNGYSLTATINAETFNLEDIDFDATVEGWDESVPQFTPYTVEVDGTSYNDFAVAVAKAMELNKPVNFFQHVAIDADKTIITVPADKALTLNLNGYTLTGVTDQTGANRDMFDVRGTMTVNGAPISRASAAVNGTISVKHIGTDMGWGASTNVFNVTAGGVLNLENVTAKNLGGSAMAFVAHLNNWGECTLNVNNSTLESTYIAVRVFNSGNDMNNVTIANTELKGKYCFWVHNYKAAGDNAGTDATLNLNIYNPAQENTFTYTSYAPVLFGFANPIYFDAYGNELIADGVGYNEESKTYTVSSLPGLNWIADKVDNGETFKGQTIKLVEDIDLEGVNFVAIGYNGGDRKYFEGTFDGNNKTIKNLKRFVRDESRRSIGLFSQVKDATVKNLTLEDFTAAATKWEAAAIACEAVGNCTFENITLKKGSVVTYNNDTAGIVGWANKGNFTFKDITIGSDVTIHSLWNSHDTALGGVVGTLESPSTVTLENITISCKLDAYNDVQANYQWGAYRRSGMVIGNMYETKTVDGRTTPDPESAGVTCRNVTVNYGDWMNYHYCEFKANGHGSYDDEYTWKCDRVEGSEWGRESNIDTDNCVHEWFESHNMLIAFDQLFGGDQGVYGLREYPGVTVNYPASYRREVSTAAALTEAIGKGVSVILDSNIDLGSTILTLDKGQTLDLGGKTLTQSGGNRGVILKNGASLKNGVINHSGIVAAVRAWNIESIENVTINLETPASGTVTGIAVQEYSTVGTIKDVTVQGAGVTQAIEVPYQATVNLIENVNVDNSAAANGVALKINGGKVGKAKNCTFKGNVYGVTMHLKGVFAVGLELENCTVEGTTASIYAFDEKGISNTSGTFDLKYDSATVFNGTKVYDFEDECKGVVTINGATLP